MASAFALGRGAVELVVVRERVRVGPYNVTMHKRRSEARAAVFRGGLKCAQADFGIGAVNLGEMEIGEVCHEP